MFEHVAHRNFAGGLRTQEYTLVSDVRACSTQELRERFENTGVYPSFRCSRTWESDLHEDPVFDIPDLTVMYKLLLTTDVKLPCTKQISLFILYI